MSREVLQQYLQAHHLRSKESMIGMVEGIIKDDWGG